MPQKIKEANVKTLPLMRAIFDELRMLRAEVGLLLPQEDVEDYAHADRIKASYQDAIKRFPPMSV